MRTLRRLLLPGLLTALMLVPAGVAAAAPDAFTDDDGTTYEPAVDALAVDDVVEGCDEAGTRFCPTEPVRRDQAASLLARALDLPATDRDYFNDDDGNTHETAINQLAAAEITLGCTGDRYCVGDTLHRDQMASLLTRSLGIDDVDDRYFRDIGGTHVDAINALAASGVTAGCADGPPRYCPGQQVLRGEMAIFLARALELRPRASLDPLPRPKPEPKPEPEPAKRSTDSRNTVWDRLAECESSGNWSINTGNGYYGGLQFSLASWRAVGGSGYPHQASRAEQIRRAEKLLDLQGWGAWPACSSKLGLR